MTSTPTTEPLPSFIGGKFVEPEEGEATDVRSPVTGEVFCSLVPASVRTVHQAVAAARAAQPSWANLTVFDRAKILHRVADLLESNQERLARALTIEQGKPFYSEALGEVTEAAENWRLAAEDAKRLRTEVLPVADRNMRVITMRKPNGVYAIIVPWNFPLLMPCELIPPAIAVGNTVVVKPSEYTPYTLNLLMELLAEAGVPDGVVNLVHGAGDVGAELVSSDVDAIAFVGSHETGAKVLKAAGYRRTLIEASGNGPVVVLGDADLAAAARGAVLGAFTCAGQICCATERVIVDRSVHDDFLSELVTEAKRWKIGDPFDRETTVGPLNNELTARKMDAHLADARARGADVIVGGKRAHGFPTDLYYEPTVVDGVGLDTLLHQEETFGPVVPVITAAGTEEALKIANDTPLGLQVAVYTNSLKDAFHFAENMRAGNVIVNGPATWWEPQVPFGGASGTKTGMGRYNGHMALLEMTDLRTIALGIDTTVAE